MLQHRYTVHVIEHPQARRQMLLHIMNPIHPGAIFQVDPYRVFIQTAPVGLFVVLLGPNNQRAARRRWPLALKPSKPVRRLIHLNQRPQECG